MTSFVKKVLVEQAELNRMQQRQLKDYSPELHSLANLHTMIAQTLARKDLSSGEKLSLLNTYQGRFDKLQRDTGAAQSAPAAPAAPAAPPPAKTVSKKADGSYASTLAGSTKESDEEEEQSEKEEKRSRTITPAGQFVRDIKIQPMYERKARNLLAKIYEYPDILKRNTSGELVVNDVAEPGTDFNALLASIVGRNPDIDQPGIDKFLTALRQIGIRAGEVRGKKLQHKYSLSGMSTRTSARGLHLKRPQDDFDYGDEHDPPNDPFAASTSPKAQPLKTKSNPKEQSGFGLKRKLPKPPGQRPKILYVY